MKYIDIDISILSIIFPRYWQTKGIFSRFTYYSQRVVCDVCRRVAVLTVDTNLSTFSQQEKLIYVYLCQSESFLSGGPWVLAQ